MQLRNIFKTKDQRKTTDSRKFYFIFPSSERDLCLYVAECMVKRYSIEFITIEYNNFDKRELEKIERQLRETCTLIVAYKEKLTPENCYKLGIAYAHRREVILINLSPLAKVERGATRYYKGIPKYVRYHFFVFYTEDFPGKFLSRIEKIISVILSGSLIDTLYQKAIDICEDVEDEAKCIIEKVDKRDFELSIQKAKALKKLSLLYIEDDDNLRYRLLCIVAKKEKDVFALLKSKEFTGEISEELSKVTNNYILGDQVMGNKAIINNDLSQSSISNFANQVKDGASQQVNRPAKEN